MCYMFNIVTQEYVNVDVCIDKILIFTGIVNTELVNTFRVYT